MLKQGILKIIENNFIFVHIIKNNVVDLYQQKQTIMKIKRLDFIEESNKMVVYEVEYISVFGIYKILTVYLNKFNDVFAKNFESGDDISSFLAERIKHQYQIDKNISWEKAKENYYK